MDLPITDDQYKRWLNREGLIQDIMPQLDANEREFLISGCYGDEYDSLFPEEEHENVDDPSETPV